MEKLRLHLYEPIISERQPEELEPDYFDDIVRKARMSGLLVEKTLFKKISDLEKYNPKGIDDTRVLLDDHRILCAWYSSIKQGKDLKYPLSLIEDKYAELLKELFKRGITFHPDEMTESARELFFETCKKLYNSGVYVPKQYSALLRTGKKTKILKRKRYDAMMEKPLWLTSQGICFGLVKFTDCQKIDKDGFQKYAEEHFVSESERIRRFGKSCNEYYLYGFQLLAEFNPIFIKFKQGYHDFIRDVKFMGSSDPYMVYPDESKTYRYVIQTHFRGKTAHLDFRLEINKELIGWTLLPQIEGEIKEPVLTLEQARKVMKEADWKIDFETGKFKKREIKSGIVRTANIRAVKKAKEPADWISVEGVAPIGTPGSTAEYPGVFLIVDKGVVEYGTNKPFFHEYFLSGGKLKGRILLRALTQEAGEYSDILERGKLPEEHEIRESFYWVAIQPLDQTPYCLSKDAVLKNWLPPSGISALPKYIRKKIPPELRYWETTDRKKALAMRKEIVERKLLDFEKMKEERFGLYRVTFKRTKGDEKIPVIVIRFGPSTEFYVLSFAGNNWACEYNPIDTETLIMKRKLSYNFEDVHSKTLVPNGTDLNPTLDTTCYVEPVDTGEINVLEDKPEFIKADFSGNKMKGLYIIVKEENSDIWTISKSELPKTFSSIYLKSSKEKQIVYYCVAQPEVVDDQGQKWSADELEDAAHLYTAGSRLIDVEHDFKPRGKFQIVESWILKDDWKLPDGRKIKKGSFCVGIHFSDIDDFRKAKSGIYLGISPAGVERK